MPLLGRRSELEILGEQFNRLSDAPFTIRYAVPTDFETVIAKRPHAPVISGDFNPIFQGTYSSRIELKQWTRNLEQLLLTAEKLSALADWLGTPPDRRCGLCAPARHAR